MAVGHEQTSLRERVRGWGVDRALASAIDPSPSPYFQAAKAKPARASFSSSNRLLQPQEKGGRLVQVEATMFTLEHAKDRVFFHKLVCIFLLLLLLLAAVQSSRQWLKDGSFAAAYVIGETTSKSASCTPRPPAPGAPNDRKERRRPPQPAGPAALLSLSGHARAGGARVCVWRIGTACCRERAKVCVCVRAVRVCRE